MRKAAIFSLLAVAGACAAAPPVKQQSRGIDFLMGCEPAPVQSLVGRKLSPALDAVAREKSGASDIRLIRPGDRISQDYQTTLLNIEVDGKSRIFRIYCG